MSMSCVRKAYQMPWLKRGLRVLTPKGPGRVTSADCHVYVRLDGRKSAMPYHPHDIKQLEQGGEDESEA